MRVRLGLKPSLKSDVAGGLGISIARFPTVETVGFLLPSREAGLQAPHIRQHQAIVGHPREVCGPESAGPSTPAAKPPPLRMTILWGIVAGKGVLRLRPKRAPLRMTIQKKSRQ